MNSTVEVDGQSDGRSLLVSSVERTATILLAFVDGPSTLGVTEIARRLELPKSVVHRTLAGLVATGLVAREEGRYRLGRKAAELGLVALGNVDVRDVAQPLMLQLSQATTETVTLSLFAGGERVYAAQVEGPQDVRMTIEVGRRYPLYAGASGRAILAYLPPDELDLYLERTPLRPLTSSTITNRERLLDELATVRKVGYSASAGERDPWAAAVAAPIYKRGRVIGCLSVCGPIGRFGPAEMERHGEAVKETAERLTRKLE